MMPLIGSIDHIGIAVTSIQKALEQYEKKLGFRLHALEEVPSEGVKVAILYSGETRVELLEAMDASSAIGKFLIQRGEGTHHLAFSVTDIKKEIDRLKKEGMSVIEPAPRTGAQGCLVAFLHPKSTHGVLIELVQRDHA